MWNSIKTAWSYALDLCQKTKSRAFDEPTKIAETVQPPTKTRLKRPVSILKYLLNRQRLYRRKKIRSSPESELSESLLDLLSTYYNNSNDLFRCDCFEKKPQKKSSISNEQEIHTDNSNHCGNMVTLTRIGNEIVCFAMETNSHHNQHSLNGSLVMKPSVQPGMERPKNGENRGRFTTTNGRPRSHSVAARAAAAIPSNILDHRNSSSNADDDEYFYEEWTENIEFGNRHHRKKDDLIREEYQERIVRSTDPSSFMNSYESQEPAAIEPMHHKNPSSHPHPQQISSSNHYRRKRNKSSKPTRNGVSRAGSMNRLVMNEFNSFSNSRMSNGSIGGDNALTITVQSHHQHKHFPTGFRFKHVTVHTIEQPMWF